jgi:polar amino acid transport system ATP-binding protein
VLALAGVDLDVSGREVVAIIGPSGSGKSTLLRCLNGLQPIDEGRIEIDGQVLVSKLPGEPETAVSGRSLRLLRAELGMVFQHFNLFPHMTALENVAEAPIQVRKLRRTEAAEKAQAMLAMVHLAHRSHHYPDQLSGGEQQRVAIARALAMEPKAMLFDEVTSALDPETVGDVLAVIRDLAAAGMTMVIVTHEMLFAEQAADRVVMMDHGRVVEIGPARQVLRTPAEHRTRTFLRRVLEHAAEFDGDLPGTGPDLQDGSSKPGRV